MAPERAVPEWFRPLDYEEVLKSWRALPHWEQIGASYFVTFRLADAVARETAERWRELKEDWIARHPRPWDVSNWERFREEVSEKMESLLDAGYGSCLLRETTARTIVSDALLYFNQQRYDLDSFVVMPNHVHILLAPREGYRLSSILHSWKSYTAHQLTRHGASSGSCWLDERFDHAVRNAAHFVKYRQYIRENPTNARLSDTSYTLWEED